MRTIPTSLVFNCKRSFGRALTLLALAGGLAAPTLSEAASGTWSSTPADATWTNVLNWNGGVVPGVVNNGVNNGISQDIANFTNALSGGIGGAGNPVIPDDGTISGQANGAKSRMVGGIVFDGPNCGAYVFWSPSPFVTTSSAGSGPETGLLNVCTNTGIIMNAAVPNPQIFLIPVGERLPTSTDGLLNVVNNATSPTATFYFANLFQNGATTRGVTFVLDGTNTGTNTIAYLSQSAVFTTGVSGMRKQGTGTWILSGANNFRASSPMNILGGTLEVKDPAAFGLSTGVVVTNGTLQIDGITLNQASVALRNGGIIRMNGVAAINGIAVGTQTATSVTLATTGASDVFTIGNAANTVSAGASDTVLHMSGPGTIVLPYAASYAGKWSLDAGTNQIADGLALGLGANYTITAGSVFDLSPLGATTYSWTTKAITANGTGTAVGSTASTIMADPGATVNLGSRSLNLTYSPTATNGDLAHPALYIAQGSVACGGNAITVNNAGAPLNVGTYRLIHQASGTINVSGTFATFIGGNGLVAGLVGEAVANGADINLIVYPYVPQNLVWSGADPLVPGQWDRLATTNWLAGATPSVFNIYDLATFNNVGIGAPTVTLTNTVVPGSVTVDTSAGSYTFTASGSGQIAGGASLTKIGANTLNLNMANNYSGGTIVNNGVIKIGADNAIPSTGTGDVAVNSPGIVDLNGFSDTINGLNGNGIVDITSGGTSTLTVGANDNNATFSGSIRNTSGTLGLLKSGLGIQTLTTSNAYNGPTIIDTGTLRASNTFALGGASSVVTITNGTLDVATNLIIAGLNGTGGNVVNASTSVTNVLTITNGGTFGGLISGKLGVYVSGGTFRVNTANAYTNATTVAGGATLAFGNLGQVGSGGVIASNGATLNMPTVNSPSPSIAANITTVDGATATFTSASTASGWNGQFIGSALATNLFSGGNMTIGGALSFTNFLGTAIMSNGTVRWFNTAAGGDNTFFWFTNGGGCFARDAVDVVHLGALGGNGVITGPTVSFPATYLIGGKGIDCEYSGGISGSNNIVKVGAARLTLDGAAVTTNTDNATYTNYIYASTISYLNTTTVSNGVLAVSVPNDLTTSPNIIVATTNAILETLNMGYVSNYLDGLGNPASALVTNGTMTIVATTPNGTPQTLGGIGLVKGNGVTNNGTINPGFSIGGGTLTISNRLVVNAGATNFFDLSDDLTGLVKASDLLKVQGNVVLSGSSVVGVGALNGNLKAGTYPVIKYTGSLINESGVVPSGIVPNFTVGGVMAATSRATMVASNGVGEVDLIVVSLNTTNLTWTGDGVSNMWDVVNSYTFTNFQNSMQFYQMDNVVFDDTANPTNDSVYLSGSVAPSSLIVNSATNYIFGGNGTIQGSVALFKKGSGSLTLTNGANSYSGGTIVSNGLLSVGMDSGNNQNDLALGTGPVTVYTNAELRFGGNAGNAVNHLITNAIVLNGGTVKAQDGVQHLTNSTVTVSAAGGSLTTVFSGKNIVLESPLLGTGNLTIAAVQAGTNAAGGQVLLLNTNNTFSGSISILTNATLALASVSGISNAAAVDVQRGGILDVSARTNAAWQVLSGQTVKGNGLIRARFVTLSAGATVAPGIAGAIGTLIVSNVGSTTAFATITNLGTLSMDINRGATPNCDLLQNNGGTNVFGGTLTINNLGAAPQAGDSFQLFTAGAYVGSFATLNLPVLGSGLIWSNSLALNGKLTVVSAVVAPTVPPGITNFSLVNGNVVISGTNGQSGATYYLLSTTNVATPRVQWKTLATNVLGAANFTFIGTNAITTGSGQQFYMLSSTNYNP